LLAGSILYTIVSIIYIAVFASSANVLGLYSTPTYIVNTIIGIIIFMTSVAGIWGSRFNAPRETAYRLMFSVLVASYVVVIMLGFSTWFSVYVTWNALFYSCIAFVVVLIWLGGLGICAWRRTKEMDFEKSRNAEMGVQV
jgi:hypothetical protein